MPWCGRTRWEPAPRGDAGAPDRLEQVAAIVNGEPGVNHNYEREHAYNLWFVVTGGSRDDLDISLAAHPRPTGLGVLDLPLERSYYIDLGFPIASGPSEKKPMREPAASVAAPLDDVDRRILSSIEHGLPLVPRPYAKIAEAARASEAGEISCLARLCETGVITRLGSSFATACSAFPPMRWRCGTLPIPTSTAWARCSHDSHV